MLLEIKQFYFKNSIRTPARTISHHPPQTPRTGTRHNAVHRQNSATDPVQVFCRLRPLASPGGDLSCARVENSTTITLTPPDLYAKQTVSNTGPLKETQYIFKHIFEPQATQREVYNAVAQPLVENLIRGKNSLLFTYGVTGSGKTFTMTGNHRDRGVMPRCLDALFRTISDFQTKKFTFKPDKLNGFEILSQEDALLERQQEMNTRFAKGRRKDSDHEIASQASVEPCAIPGIDEDNMYAVFVTYVEVYNNSVFDLLEETPLNNQKNLQSKIVREDANHNMYVHGVTEIEIKSVEEAIEVFQIGQKRKKTGHTLLNAESSRSHSVFTIRLVQAPTDSQGENVIQNRNVITISQLSLVDLAGSERTNRTKNQGQRLREASNINNSLMNLRTCLECLRENQINGNNKKMPPYRNSKVTHLFKNYFDGEGQVSMIVCVNPRAEDYDENVQVMQFAEMTQQVQIARPSVQKLDVGLSAGRRKANKLFKMAVNNLNDLGHTEAKTLEVDLGLVYTLGPSFPNFQMDSPESNAVINDLMNYLQHRIEKRKALKGDIENRCDNFRMLLMKLEKENLMLKTENATLQAGLKQEREKHIVLENKLQRYEDTIDELNRKVRSREEKIKEFQKKLHEVSNKLSQKALDEEKQKKHYNAKLACELDKNSRELELKLQRQRDKCRVKEEKIRMVSEIVNSENIQLPNLVRSLSSEQVGHPESKPNPPPKPLDIIATPRVTSRVSFSIIKYSLKL